VISPLPLSITINESDNPMTTNASTNNNQYVAINVEGLPDGCVGRAVFWVPNGTVPYQPVEDALRDAGFADEEMCLIPNKPSPMVALRRAMDAVSRQHNVAGQPQFYVSPLSSGGKGKKNKLGWLIAQQREDSQIVAGNSAATVDLVCHTEFFEKDGEQQIKFTFDPPDHPYRDEIEAKYDYHLNHLAGDDISHFLTQTVARSKLFSMVPLRPTGGFYYMSPAAIQVWDIFTRAFSAVSGARFHHINVLNSEASMVEAALSGITELYAKRIQTLTEELQKDVGMRKLNNATEEVAEMLRTASAHEAILGGSLTDLREQADRLGTTLRLMIARHEAQQIAKDTNNGN
jgi:hypothetical protein